MPGNYSVHGSGGVFRSTNNGTSWTSVNSNLPNWWATDAVFIENSYLFVSTCCEGIFLSTDLGTSWSLIESSPKGVPCFMVHGLYLFAGGMDGVYRSTDDGMTWAQVNQGMSLSITCVAVRGSSLYAGTRSGGIFLTTDDGTSWTHLSDCSGFIDALVVTDTTIVASNGGSQGHGPDGNIFLSTDNGESWTTINSNLTNTNAWALAISGPYIFAGTQGGGVFRTNNNGTSWTQVNSGLSNDTVRALAANDTNVFAGTQEGLSHSTDNGNSWSKIDIQVNSGQKFVSVGTLAMRGDSLFACTDQGAYFSIDNGTTWTAMPGASLMDILALAATNNYLFAGTSHSVWRAPISEVTDVRVFSQVLSMSYLLEQNYPNPFNPTTVISYQLPTNTLVALKVFDILGREVKTLVDERQSTGSHSVRFNATNLPSGVYFYRLEAGTYRDTEKMLLLK